jgi:hypothetical protein
MQIPSRFGLSDAQGRTPSLRHVSRHQSLCHARRIDARLRSNEVGTPSSEAKPYGMVVLSRFGEMPTNEMWGVVGRPERSNWLNLEPVTVLYEFDGPRIFVCRDALGNTYLAYLCGDDRGGMRYLVVPFSADLERRLVVGQINLRDALTMPSAWLFDIGNDWRPTACWKIDVDDLPPSVLPAPGVMLYSHLRPIIRETVARPAANSTVQNLVIAPAFRTRGVDRREKYAVA